MKFGNFQRPNPLQVLARSFVTLIRATFTFGASQSELNFSNLKSMINLYNIKTLPLNIH